MKDLSERQQQLFSFILGYMVENLSQPSYRDMMVHMAVSSPNAIQSMLQGIEKKGYIERQNKARGLKILKREIA